MAELCASMPAVLVSYTFVQYVIALCSQSEATSDVISDRFVRMYVPNKCVKFRDPRLKRSPEIRSDAARGDSFSNIHKCQQSIVSGVVVD